MSEDTHRLTPAEATAHQEARRQWVAASTRWLDPAFRRAEIARLAAEAAAVVPDQATPRAALRQAHQARAEAAAEASRLEAVLERAATHLDAVMSERDRMRAEVAEIERQSAEKLAAALRSGADSEPGSEAAGGELRAALIEAEAAVTIAAQAAETIAAEHKASQQRVIEVEASVKRAAVAVLLQHAAAQAEALFALERELVATRDTLDALARAVTDSQRTDWVRSPWPPAIGQAIAPLEPPRGGRASEAQVVSWAVLADLVVDPAAHPDLSL